MMEYKELRQKLTKEFYEQINDYPLVKQQFEAVGTTAEDFVDMIIEHNDPV
jgi:hypothetical protein